MNQLVEFQVGVGFHDNFGKHLGSDVWHIIASSIDEAEELFINVVHDHIRNMEVKAEIIDYSHEWLSMRAVNQTTWIPYGEEIAL